MRKDLAISGFRDFEICLNATSKEISKSRNLKISKLFLPCAHECASTIYRQVF